MVRSIRGFGSGLATSSAVLLVCLLPAPPALATHGGSHVPAPSGSDCKWYGSVSHEHQVHTASESGFTTDWDFSGSGWSGPSDDSTCRGTLQYSHHQRDTGPGWWNQRDGETTVPADYQAGWSSEPGTFLAGFYGDEPVTLVLTDSSGGEPGTQESPTGTQVSCAVPGADTAAKRASIQAVVVTCSQLSQESPGTTWTGTIRMRRTNCDRTVDTDGDGLSDCREYALETEPHNPDTDGDGLTDGDEVLTHGTDPRDSDTDGGGVEDGVEISQGTDPHDPADDEEETDCNDGSSNDFDGIADYPADPGCTSEDDESELGDWECDNGGDDDEDAKTDFPLDPECESPVDDAEGLDTDGDGLSDEGERDNYKTDPFDVDSDNDDLEDGQEVQTTGTEPLDADSDNGGVMDGRELEEVVPSTDPNDGFDDLLRHPYSLWWDDLVEQVREDYVDAQDLGGATAGYYHQVLNLVCSAGGVASDVSASQDSIDACVPMKAEVGSAYGKWSADFVWEVFADFIPGAHADEEIEAKANMLTRATCTVFLKNLNYNLVRKCIRAIREEVGFAWAGTLHAAHHLYPNFKEYFEEQLVQAQKPSGKVRTSILEGNLAAARENHSNGLFKKAVLPGFEVVDEINDPAQFGFQKIVPKIAACERESAIREAYKDVLGSDEGKDLYRRVTHPEARTAESKYCRGWMALVGLLE